jgi:adhesin transport system outer membrane protein
LLCIVSLIGGLPLYSNATDPEFGLVAQPPIFFQSPEYLHLLWQKVIQAHPQALGQLQALKAMGFEVATTEQAFYPTPSITMERAQSSGGFDPAYAGAAQVMTFRLQQPLWTGGRLAAQNTKALANQRIEVARLAEVQQNLALQTLQSWLIVVAAQRQQTALQRSQKIHQALLTSIKRRAELGQSSGSEVSFSKLRLMQLEQELRLSQLQESQAWLRLLQWVPEAAGLTQNEKPKREEPFAVAWHEAPLVSTDWTEDAWAQSPLAMRLAGVKEAQNADIQEKKAMLQPEVYVRAEHQRGNYAYANTPHVNRIFVGFTASTGAGLSLQNQLASLQTKLDATQLEMTLAKGQLNETVQSDVLNVNARQSKSADLQLNLNSAIDIQSAWQRQFEAGRKSWVEVMNAARETSQAEIAVIENDMALQLSYWKLQIQAHGVLRWAMP